MSVNVQPTTNASVDLTSASVDQINASVDQSNASVDQINAEALSSRAAVVVLLQRVLQPVLEELLASAVWNVRELAVCVK